MATMKSILKRRNRTLYADSKKDSVAFLRKLEREYGSVGEIPIDQLMTALNAMHKNGIPEKQILRRVKAVPGNSLSDVFKFYGYRLG